MIHFLLVVIKHLSHNIPKGLLTHDQTTTGQASLCKCAVSQEPLQFSHTIYRTRRSYWPRAGDLGPMNCWECTDNWSNWKYTLTTLFVWHCSFQTERPSIIRVQRYNKGKVQRFPTTSQEAYVTPMQSNSVVLKISGLLCKSLFTNNKQGQGFKQWVSPSLSLWEMAQCPRLTS